MNERKPVKIYFNDTFWRYGYIENNKIYIDDDPSIRNDPQELIVAKDKNIEGFKVGRERDPKISGPGWTRIDDKGNARKDEPRNGWKTVKKDEK